MEIINKITQNVRGVLNSSNKKIKWIDIDKINVDPEFKAIFPQKEADVQKIVESLKNGFDPAFPIILTKNVPGVPDGTNVDGHSRLEACQIANIHKLAYIEKSFVDREAIIEFIYQTQMARRNLTEQEQFSYYQKMAARKKDNGMQVKTDQQIADDLEISRRQITKFKEVEKKADSKTLEAFKSGQISLNAAYQKMKAEEVTANSNKQNPVSKPVNKTYENGYSDGLKYAIQEIEKGRSTSDLLSELREEIVDE